MVYNFLGFNVFAAFNDFDRQENDYFCQIGIKKLGTLCVTQESADLVEKLNGIQPSRLPYYSFAIHYNCLAVGLILPSLPYGALRRLKISD